MQDLFIEMLHVTLGTRDYLSRVPSSDEWVAIYNEAERQAVAGIMVSGLERLPDNQRPSQVVLLQWIGVCLKIELQNQITTQTCKRVCDRFEMDGFAACVLKGQSNYRYYPQNMINRRSSGDIDVWVEPSDTTCKHPVKKVIEYVRDRHDMNGLCWLHTSHVEKNGMPVEVHMRASFMNDPCKNRRFQKHFSNIECFVCREVVNGVDIPTMKVDEDVIYQMNHLYRHLIDEGVGLRQVIDYYYLLNVWNEKHSRTKEDTLKIISWLGMGKFAGALMYVLSEVCGMSDKLLLCPAQIKDGEFLMNEILLSGNFGHGDSRMTAVKGNGYYQARTNQAKRRFKRNMRFLTSYPGEVIWEPWTRVSHFVWKKLKLWRF